MSTSSAATTTPTTTVIPPSLSTETAPILPPTTHAAHAAPSAIDTSSPYFLHPSDQPGQPLVSQLLDGDNYPTWSRAITTALQAKNKLGFIDGTLSEPHESSPDHARWIRCNSMVQSWLTQSTIPTIAHSIIWTPYARTIWLDLHERFSQQNAPRIFEIRRMISNLRQDTSSLSSYYTLINGLRDELASYCSFPICTCGALTHLNSMSDADYLMDFLQGLNDSYAAIRSHILLMDLLPSVNKAYSLLLQEERQRSLHLSRPPTTDQVALLGQQQTKSSSRGKQGEKPRYHCTLCNQDGHSNSRCYKVIGYPDWWPNRNTTSRGTTNRCTTTTPTHSRPLSAAVSTPTASNSSGLSSVNDITTEQLQQLLALIPSGNTTSLANMTGKSRCFSSSSSNHVWIIDSGATDHMICSLSLFSSYTTSAVSSIRLPNDHLVSVTHT